MDFFPLSSPSGKSRPTSLWVLILVVILILVLAITVVALAVWVYNECENAYPSSTTAETLASPRILVV